MTFNPLRALGLTMVVLGFGSAYLRTQMGVDTALTTWMAPAQPYAGIVMGLIGLAIVGLAVRRARLHPVE